VTFEPFAAEEMPPGVIGVGVDVVDLARFEQVLDRSPGIVTRVFTDREIALCDRGASRAWSLAVRWAAKEAVAKVLVDTRGLSWHECEVLTGDRGAPVLVVSGRIAEVSRERGIARWLLSLSHDGPMGIAFVIASRA
jgi:holo-[acyl-carrier protein] synthase